MAKGQDSRENSNDDIGLTTVKKGRGKEGGSGRMSLGSSGKVVVRLMRSPCAHPAPLSPESGGNGPSLISHHGHPQRCHSRSCQLTMLSRASF